MRDLTRLYRQQPEYKWRCDSWTERAEAFFWRHPWLAAALKVGIFAAAGAWLGRCLWSGL